MLRVQRWLSWRKRKVWLWVGADLSLFIKSHSVACECSLGQECGAETCQDTKFFILSERNGYWEICQLSWVCSKARGDLRTTDFSAGLVGSERPGSGVGFEPIAWAPSLTLGFQAPWLCVFCLRFFVCLFLAQMLFLPVLTDKSSISVSHYCGAWSLWAPT